MSNLPWQLAASLDHAEKMYGFSDAGDPYGENLDRNIPELVRLGYLQGRWFGSLDREPMRCWHITDAGSEALKQYKLAELRRTVPKCAESACRGPYASEVYLRTDCETCGHPIIRERIRYDQA